MPNLNKKENLIGTEINGLGTVLDIIGKPGHPRCNYKIDFIEGHPAQTHNKTGWVRQIVIDTYNVS